VEHRCAALRKTLGAYGATEELHGHNSDAFWREVRDVAPLLPEADRIVWRISVPPAAGPGVASALQAVLDAESFFDWGGGLIWAAVKPDPADGGESVVRGAVAKSGGHATLIRAPEDLRRTVPVFQPQPAPFAKLRDGIKEAFDPRGLFNPGRMR
jgi:glycolate oxidase FAD binding subunit